MFYIAAFVILMLAIVVIVVIRHRDTVKARATRKVMGPTYVNASDILAKGKFTRATVVGCMPYGMSAPNGDPFMVITLNVIPAGETPFQGIITQRVPPEKLALTSVGTQLIIAFDPDNRTRRLAIDWDAMPVPPQPGVPLSESHTPSTMN